MWDDGETSSLFGRDDELRRLAAVLGAVESAAASVIVQGEPGQGKTSLLRWMADAAATRGFTVLRATGIEFERRLPFSGLMAVLRPLQPRADDLDATHRQALQTALGLAEGDAPALRTYVATLSLLSRAAEAAPVLVVVDDAHWIDPASLEALIFAAHRGGADRVGFAFAQRTGASCLLDRTSFDRIELVGLARGAAVQLLGEEGMAADVAGRCWEMSGGNPLALIEGVRGLSPSQREGTEPLPPVLRAADHLLAGFRTRVRGLPPATLRALGVATLEPSDEIDVIRAALTATGDGIDDLGPAERSGIVELAGGRVAWRHPLLRSAVYQLTEPDRRRAVHHVLADVASAAGREEQAAWHLSEAILGRDDEAAARLAHLGATSRRKGALSAAADAYERAARLAADAVRAEGYAQAAAAARLADGDYTRTAELLVPLIDRTDDPVSRARMATMLGEVEMWLDGPARGIERFERHAAEVAGTRPDLATFLLFGAATSRLVALDAAGAVATASRAVEMARTAGSGAAELAASVVTTVAQLFAGGAGDRRTELHQAAGFVVPALDAVVSGADDMAQLCAFGFLLAEDWAAAADLLHRVIPASEGLGKIGRPALARLLLSEVLWRAGRWSESQAALTHSLSLQEAAGRQQVMPGTLGQLARVEAGLGLTESCRSHATQAVEAAVAAHSDMYVATALSGLGLLLLGGGRLEEAAEAFDQVASKVGHLPDPGWLWWEADAIEAYAGCGRIDDAVAALDRLSTKAEATGRAWARAAVERARALLLGAGPPDGRVGQEGHGGRGASADDHFTAAVEGFRYLGAPFEEGRTLLSRGQHRMRLGSRREGGHDVAAARTVFDRLGARAWSERAAAVAGEAGTARTALVSQLTPAELRVAVAVSQGASNREAADQLFISVKTVDYHLQNTYRKLGLRSRTQLAALVLSGA